MDSMVMKHFFFCFAFVWALHSGSAQVLLLAVPNGIIPGHAQGAIWSARDLTWICLVQGTYLQNPSWNILGRNVHTVTWISLPFSINDKTLPVSSQTSLTFQPHFTLGSTASSGQHSLDSMQLKSTERTLLQGCRQGQQCPGSPAWQEQGCNVGTHSQHWELSEDEEQTLCWEGTCKGEKPVVRNSGWPRGRVMSQVRSHFRECPLIHHKSGWSYTQQHH